MNPIIAFYSDNGKILLVKNTETIQINASSTASIKLLNHILSRNRQGIALHINRNYLFWGDATESDKNEIKDCSILFSAGTRIDGCVVFDKIDFNEDTIRKLIIYLRLDNLDTNLYRWNSNSDLKDLKSNLGISIPWKGWINSINKPIVKICDLPKWIKEIILHYDSKPSLEYRVENYLLIDTRSTFYESRGVGFILGKSRVNKSEIYRSLVYNSYLLRSSIRSSIVLESKLTTSQVSGSLIINCNRITKSNLIGSTVINSRSNGSDIIYSYAINSIFIDSSIRSSFLQTKDVANPIMHKWEIEYAIINDLKSFKIIGKMYRIKGLTTKVHDYYCKEANRLKRFGKEEFICGIEIEAIAENKILYKPSYCRVKPDGSLNNGGLEIATRPDSPDSHLRNLKRMFNINKLSIDSSCGMHVHVPKSIGNLEAIRERIYKNKKRYYRISGRRENTYCYYKRNEGRHQAINVTKNTIEFRLFSSTTNIHKINRRLQWIKKMCEWSKKNNLTKKQLANARIERMQNDGLMW